MRTAGPTGTVRLGHPGSSAMPSASANRAEGLLRKARHELEAALRAAEAAAEGTPEEEAVIREHPATGERMDAS